MLSRFLEKLAELGIDPNRNSAQTLDAMLQAHQLTHALILESEDSEALEKLAELTAKTALCRCEEPLFGECDICRIFSEGRTVPDIITVEGSGANGAISVGAIRELRRERSLAPLVADNVICILKGADLMQKEAQNAFLKLFEEPPEGVKFILCCASSTKLLETIRSRGTVLRFGSASNSADEISDELRAFADKLLLSIATSSEADTILLSSYFAYRDGDEVRRRLRREIAQVCDRIEHILRDSLIISAGAPELALCGSPAAKKLAESLPPARLQAMIEEIPSLRAAAKANAPLPLLATALCIKLRRSAGK